MDSSLYFSFLLFPSLSRSQTLVSLSLLSPVPLLGTRNTGAYRAGEPGRRDSSHELGKHEGEDDDDDDDDDIGVDGPRKNERLTEEEARSREPATFTRTEFKRGSIS